MKQMFEILFVVAMISVGSFGWGSLALFGLRRFIHDDAEPRDSWPVAIVVGTSLFLCFSGYLVAMNAATIVPLAGFHFAGILIALVVFARKIRRSATNLTVSIRRTLNFVLWAALSVVVVIATLGASSAFLFNPNDDEPSYFYFAQRLISTGGLIDPFNQRRITGYGGTTTYQAIFLRLSGAHSTQAFDLVFGALLTIALVVAARRRPLWLLGSVGVAAVIVLGTGEGPLANLSPRYSSTALVLGALLFAASIDGQNGHRPTSYPRLLVGGLMVAGAMSFRTELAFPLGLSYLTVSLRAPSWGLRMRRAGWLLIGTVGGILGWAIASYRSSGTPLFPLIAGNNTGVPSTMQPRASAMFVVRILGQLFRYDDTGILVAASLAASFGVWIVWRRRRAPATEPVIALAMGLGCAVQMAANAYLFSGGAVLDIARYSGPSDVAFGLLVIDLVWRPEMARPTTGDNLTISRFRGVQVSTAAVVTVTIVIVGGLCAGTNLATMRGYFTGYRESVQAEAHVSGVPDPFATLLPQYHDVSSLIPSGSRVFTAVEYPFLLDFEKYTFVTLDLAGAASPKPAMPYFTGPAAKISYLQRAGYSYLLVSSSSASGLYNEAQWQYGLTYPNSYTQNLSRLMLDWLKVPRYIEYLKQYPKRTVGTLTLYRILSPSVTRR